MSGGPAHDHHTDEQLDRLLGRIATAGASSTTAFALDLGPGAREWFWRYLERHHADLVDAYTPSCIAAARAWCAPTPPISRVASVLCCAGTGGIVRRGCG